MGRKKIQISRIQDERNRQITFSKRKAGLLKKAYELSVLCDVEVAVIMISNNNKLYQYASSNMNSILIRYTEFKDPDESKTNADILEDITRKEKGGQDRDKDDTDDENGQFLVAPSSEQGSTSYHQHYHRHHHMSENFEQALQNQISTTHTQVPPVHQPLPPAPLISPRVPQAMPVSIPVSASSGSRAPQHIHPQPGSAGSTGSSSSGTPFSPDTTSSFSPASSASIMPPPSGTPTRLQTIRNQTLKLHLPGSGRQYISLGSGSGSAGSGSGASEKKSPTTDDSGGRGARGAESGADTGGTASASRPQLRVVLPGQKGFVYRSAPSSPPPMVGLENTDPVTTSPALTVTSVQGGLSTNTPASLNPAGTSMESLTTPIVSLSTPNILSNLSPLLSSLTSELPLSSGGDSASALVAFPVSIQPTPGSSKGQAPGSNIVLQAQNMGQPFLLAPSANYENKSQMQSSLPLTPSSNPSLGLSPPLIRDLEQLKLQYDRIYQQISQTLQHHQLHQHHSQKDKPSSDNDGGSPPPVATSDGIYQQISQTLQNHQLHQHHSQNPSSDNDGGSPPHVATGNGGGGDGTTASESRDASNSSSEQESAAKRPRLDIPTTTHS